MTPGTYNFTIYRGVSLRKTLTYEMPDGTPIPLTGLSVELRMSPHGHLVDPPFTKALDTIEEAGIIDLALTPEETAGLRPSDLWHYAIVLSDGEDVDLFLIGETAVKDKALPESEAA